MGKLSNILVMLQLMNTGKKYSIKELADYLEVTERMVRVYKDELEKAGIYIRTIKGPYGGYVLDKKFDFAKRIEKKEVPTIIKERYKQYEEEERLKYNMLSRAIKEKIKVEIVYISTKFGTLKRIIRPYEIFLYGESLYVGGYCELKKGIRNFRLTRILEYKMTNEKF